LTIIGNITADPEVRTVGNGSTVANFTIASTPRTFNRDTNQWEDGQALFMRCSAWRDLAKHVADSLAKGMRVIASGTISQRQYQANDGSNRTVVEMTVDEIGPSLRYATAQVQRENKTTGYNGQQGYAQPSQQYGKANPVPNAYTDTRPVTQTNAIVAPAAPAADPWGASQSGFNGGRFGGSSDFGGGDPDSPEF
jgi:single-strand DNA-binding protein